MSDTLPHYRTYLLQRVVEHVILPPAVLLATIRLLGLDASLGGLAQTALALASVPAALYVRETLHEARTARRAAALGAQPVPRVRGRWPGNLDIVLRGVREARDGYVSGAFKAILAEHGVTTLNVRLLWSDLIVTVDENHVRQMLATEFDSFDKGEEQRMRFYGLFGTGIFNSDGDAWKNHRALTRPFFARERIADFDKFAQYTAEALDVLADVVRNGPLDGAVDFQDLAARFTMDAACAVLFGAEMHTLRGPLPRAGAARLGAKGALVDVADARGLGAFVRAFEEAQRSSASRLRLGRMWVVREALTDAVAPHARAMHAFLEPLVEGALKAKEARRKAGVKVDAAEKQTNLLEYLADNCDDVMVIRDELLNILLAGRDTTASLLTFVIYLCTQHPEAWDKMRAEALHVCGSDGVPSYESLRELKYMRAVVNETLRLFPPVVANLRTTRAEGAVLRPGAAASSAAPLYVPPHTPVGYMTMLIHRRPELWGMDAEAFDPERWLNPERVKRFTANPMMWVPFNAGPRICLGQQFAYSEAQFFLARLLQRYKAVHLAQDAFPPGSAWRVRGADGSREACEQCWPMSAITLYSKGGMWVRFSPV